MSHKARQPPPEKALLGHSTIWIIQTQTTAIMEHGQICDQIYLPSLFDVNRNVALTVGPRYEERSAITVTSRQGWKWSAQTEDWWSRVRCQMAGWSWSADELVGSPPPNHLTLLAPCFNLLHHQPGPYIVSKHYSHLNPHSRILSYSYSTILLCVLHRSSLSWLADRPK